MSENPLKLHGNEMLREAGKQKYLCLFSSLLWEMLASVDLSWGLELESCVRYYLWKALLPPITPGT